MLRCLQSLYDGGVPEFIQTDRELGLLNALRIVYPDVQHQLCWVHILRNCGDKALELGKSVDIQSRFKSDVTGLMNSQSIVSYQRRKRLMHAAWAGVPGLMAYLETTWLVPYAPNIVRAWTDRALHFGSRTTNRYANYPIPHTPGVICNAN